MPTLSDALCVHSQAHETQCVELHDVALKMLVLSGQTHICTDGLDEQAEETVLDAVPGAICLDSEAAALLPPPVWQGLGNCRGDGLEGTSGGTERQVT